ncbi:hypothetical protein chiPu_0014461 [Chiloscyllium punctatum]|uniref:Uncharacterized protein n=1 Tax=Chiloscyllium punctatum TaxID=137246 RepID=A0A401T030_CHIPU|nr:hypothetical protein [Chiloscyllium punctatum]
MFGGMRPYSDIGRTCQYCACARRCLPVCALIPTGDGFVNTARAQIRRLVENNSGINAQARSSQVLWEPISERKRPRAQEAELETESTNSQPLPTYLSESPLCLKWTSMDRFYWRLVLLLVHIE